MRLLLDTHAFLWAASSPEKLAENACAAIVDAANEVFVSAAVAWEIGIKSALGKITLPGDAASWFPARVRALRFQTLPITAEHGIAVASLPGAHRDPFDRILIAQAQLEGMVLVSRDPVMREYAVNVLPA